MAFCFRIFLKVNAEFFSKSHKVWSKSKKTSVIPLLNIIPFKNSLIKF